MKMILIDSYNKFIRVFNIESSITFKKILHITEYLLPFIVLLYFRYKGIKENAD